MNNNEIKIPNDVKKPPNEIKTSNELKPPNEIKTPRFIVAGNYAEAVFIAKNNNLSNRDWTYITSEYQLQGLRDFHVWFYGSYDRLYNIEQIKDMIITNDGTIEYIKPYTASW